MKTIVNKKTDNNSTLTGQSLVNIAQLCGIIIKRGWKKKLAEQAGVRQTQLYGWLRNDSICDDGIAKLSQLHPPNKWLIQKRITYQHQENTDNYTNDKNGNIGYNAETNKSIEPTMVHTAYKAQNHRWHESLEEILNDGDDREVEAIKTNLESFVHTTRLNVAHAKQQAEEVTRAAEMANLRNDLNESKRAQDALRKEFAAFRRELFGGRTETNRLQGTGG